MNNGVVGRGSSTPPFPPDPLRSTSARGMWNTFQACIHTRINQYYIDMSLLINHPFSNSIMPHLRVKSVRFHHLPIR